MAKDAKKTEAVVETAAEEVKADSKPDVEKFIARKLKAINQMENEAKARDLASRVLSNRRRGK